MPSHPDQPKTEARRTEGSEGSIVEGQKEARDASLAEGCSGSGADPVSFPREHATQVPENSGKHFAFLEVQGKRGAYADGSSQGDDGASQGDDESSQDDGESSDDDEFLLQVQTKLSPEKLSALEETTGPSRVKDYNSLFSRQLDLLARAPLLDVTRTALSEVLKEPRNQGWKDIVSLPDSEQAAPTWLQTDVCLNGPLRETYVCLFSALSQKLKGAATRQEKYVILSLIERHGPEPLSARPGDYKALFDPARFPTLTIHEIVQEADYMISLPPSKIGSEKYYLHSVEFTESLERSIEDHSQRGDSEPDRS